VIRFLEPSPVKPPSPPCTTLVPSLQLAHQRFVAGDTSAARDTVTVLAPWAGYCARDPTLERQLYFLATPSPNEDPQTALARVLERLRSVEVIEKE
jgi:hypothetical protein